MLYKIYDRNPSKGPPTFEDTLSYYPEEHEKYKQSVENAVKQTEPYSYDIQMRTEDDDQKYVHVEGIPETDENGEVIKLFGIVQDITLRKQAENKVNQALPCANIVNELIPSSF